MKIAIFTDTYEPEINGVVTSTKTFIKMLASDGHEVILICPKYKGHKDDELDNVKVFRFRAFSFATNKSTKISFPSLPKIIKILKNENPDLIHIQTPMNIGVTGLVASKILKIKNIQTYHTYLPEMMVYLKPSNVLGVKKIKDALTEKEIISDILNNGFYQRIKRISLQTTHSYLALLDKYKIKTEGDLGVWLFTKSIYNRSNMVLTPSKALTRILKNKGIKPPVYFQTNGIDFSGIIEKKDYKKTGKIIHFGRLGPEKKTDIIIRSLQNINDVELHIFGDGPDRKRLEKLSLELSLNDRVRFFGFMPNEKIRKIIHEYDFFITASPMETQGIVILEAMAAGLPIIGVNKLAIPDLVKGGLNGYLVKEGDPNLMGEKIKEILKSESRRKKMGSYSQKMAKEHDIEKAYKLLVKRYKSLA